MSDSNKNTALLVIDVQESFRHRPYFDARELAAYLAAQNALIAESRTAGLPIVRILHVESEGVFSLASGFVTPLAGLIDFEPALEVRKHRHSALAGTDLAAWLTERGIRRLIVSGIRTEQCCETTTRAASDAGFEVDYVTEATLTFAIQHASGRVFSPVEIRERTELVLEGRFAKVCSVEEALARAGAPVAA
jgi:nicotinamidase-related amidase